MASPFLVSLCQSQTDLFIFLGLIQPGGGGWSEIQVSFTHQRERFKGKKKLRNIFVFGISRVECQLHIWYMPQKIILPGQWRASAICYMNECGRHHTEWNRIHIKDENCLIELACGIEKNNWVLEIGQWLWGAAIRGDNGELLARAPILGLRWERRESVLGVLEWSHSLASLRYAEKKPEVLSSPPNPPPGPLQEGKNMLMDLIVIIMAYC